MSPLPRLSVRRLARFVDRSRRCNRPAGRRRKLRLTLLPLEERVVPVLVNYQVTNSVEGASVVLVGNNYAFGWGVTDDQGYAAIAAPDPWPGVAGTVSPFPKCLPPELLN